MARHGHPRSDERVGPVAKASTGYGRAWTIRRPTRMRGRRCPSLSIGFALLRTPRTLRNPRPRALFFKVDRRVSSVFGASRQILSRCSELLIFDVVLNIGVQMVRYEFGGGGTSSPARAWAGCQRSSLTSASRPTDRSCSAMYHDAHRPITACGAGAAIQLALRKGKEIPCLRSFR